jgi:hypothetical protein
MKKYTNTEKYRKSVFIFIPLSIFYIAFGITLLLNYLEIIEERFSYNDNEGCEKKSICHI